MAKTQAIARKAQIDLNNADHRQQLLNLKNLLRQKVKAKGARLRRYNKLTKIKQQNAAFENNQKHDDIKMSFDLDKFATLSIVKGAPHNNPEVYDDIHQLPPEEQYRYLGVCQDGRINHTQLKKELQKKYKSRVTKLLNPLLSGGNLIKAINSWAVPVSESSFAFGPGNPAYPSYARRSKVGESNFVYGCGKPAYSGYAWGASDGPLPGVRQGMSGAGAGHDSMRDVGGRQLRRRAPVAQEATAPNPNPNSKSQTNRGVDDTRRAEDYEAPLPQGSPAVRRRAARRREDTRRLKWTVEMNIEVMRTFYIINHCRDEPLPGWRHSLHIFNYRKSREKSARSYINKRSSKIHRKYVRKKKSSHSKDVSPERNHRPDQREELVMYTYREASMKNDKNDFFNYANSILQQYLDGTNDLQKAHLGVYCASALILELNGQQVYTPNPNRKNKDSDTPMWKKRLEKNIDEYRADADVLSEFLAGNNSRRVMAKTQATARKAQIDLNNADHRQQLLNLKDLLRQKAKARVPGYVDTTS
ncbi:hypothetical protein NQ318_007845 [Aromia moschata]|uniref:Uncharacterized protein n=1 Tax=Aromia moschata TaxID=1265417 RepID=A0AAV8Z1L7_9CUCU|nr:hypothetical protein NQ318_007845 [Aromia moschata]